MELKNDSDSSLSKGSDDNVENKISSNEKILDTNTASSEKIDLNRLSSTKDDKVISGGDSRTIKEDSDDTVKVGSLYSMINNNRKNEDNLSTQSNITSTSNSSKATEKNERVSDLTAKEIESKINSRVSSVKTSKDDNDYGRNLKEITPKSTDSETSKLTEKATKSRSSYLNTSYTGKEGVNRGSSMDRENKENKGYNTEKFTNKDNYMTSKDNNSSKDSGIGNHIKKDTYIKDNYFASTASNVAKNNSATKTTDTTYSKNTYNDNYSSRYNKDNYDDNYYSEGGYNDNYGEDNYDDDYEKQDKKATKKSVSKLKAFMCVTLGVLVVAFCVWLFMFDGKDILFTSKATVAKNKEEVKVAFDKYFTNLNDGLNINSNENKDKNENKFSDMYDSLTSESKGKISKDAFVQRNKKIYSGMGVSKVETEIKGDITTDKKKKDYTVNYTQKLNTIAGEITFDNSVTFAKVKVEGTDEYWGMKWDHNVIHPDLKESYKVQVETDNYTPKRGSILDRNGEVLAQSDENGNRSYPQGEVCCHMVGMVGSPTAEDLKELDKEIYDEHSKIGKKGLEYAFEDRLRGTKGGKIVIKDEQGKDVKTLVESEVKNGEDITTSIDLKYQKSAYKALKDRRGTFVGMDPNTGEVLALISTPAYDPATGKSSAPDSDTPFVTRYAQAYCPGSSFKPLNAGIGLTGGFYDEKTSVSYSGTEYTRPGWGNYTLKTTSNNGKEHTLVNALTISDNIYFGLMALDHIKRDNLMKGLDNLGFGEIFPFEIKPQKPSIYCTDKKTALDSDAAVANTGFGQGQLMINPIHMASIYSTFVKDGSMVQPTIEHKEGASLKYYKENVFSKDAVSKINEGLKSVVQNGTATAAKSASVSVAGKTGTAELKASREEKNGIQNGWFCGYTFNTDKPMVFVTFTENVGEDHSLVVRKATDIINGCY